MRFDCCLFTTGGPQSRLEASSSRCKEGNLLSYTVHGTTRQRESNCSEEVELLLTLQPLQITLGRARSPEGLREENNKRCPKYSSTHSFRSPSNECHTLSGSSCRASGTIPKQKAGQENALVLWWFGWLWRIWRDSSQTTVRGTYEMVIGVQPCLVNTAPYSHGHPHSSK